MGDPSVSLYGGALSPLLGGTSLPGVTPSEEWALTEILGSAYGYSIGFTAASVAPYPPGPVGDITFWVLEGAAWIERTDWMMYPLKRSASVGSRGTLSITLTNAGKAAGVVWRPTQFEDVILYIGDYLFFRGQYYYGTESVMAPIDITGTWYYKITGTCLTYDDRMDHIMIRQLLQLPDPVDPTITVFLVGQWIQIFVLDRMQTDIGIIMSCNIGPFDALPTFQHNETWDTVSVLAACKSICDEFGLEMYLDSSLQLWFWNVVTPGANGLPNSAGNAPFSIVDLTPDAGSEPLWQNMTVTNGGTQYANRAYVKNNQIQKGNTGDANPFTLSYVPFAENATEVARVGPYAVNQSSKNQSLSNIDAMTESGLVDFELHACNLETFQIGFEPGQALTINTTLPLLDDVLQIESVDSDLVGPFTGVTPFISTTGPIRFAHSIKADNYNGSRRSAGWRVWQGIVDGIAPPVDRTTYTPSWEIAITIPGQANPGVAVTDVFADMPALRDGIINHVTIGPFKVPPATTDLIFDILLNGTSIFPGSPGGMSYPVGVSNAAVSFTFVTDPLTIKGPYAASTGATQTVDHLSLVVLQGDAAAQDGVVAITVQG